MRPRRKKREPPWSKPWQRPLLAGAEKAEERGAGLSLDRAGPRLTASRKVGQLRKNPVENINGTQPEDLTQEYFNRRMSKRGSVPVENAMEEKESSQHNT